MIIRVADREALHSYTSAMRKMPMSVKNMHLEWKLTAERFVLISLSLSELTLQLPASTLESQLLVTTGAAAEIAVLLLPFMIAEIEEVTVAAGTGIVAMITVALDTLEAGAGPTPHGLRRKSEGNEGEKNV